MQAGEYQSINVYNNHAIGFYRTSTGADGAVTTTYNAGYGGGIYAYQDLYANNLNVDNNTATTAGGGIYNGTHSGGATYVTLTNTKITNNLVVYDGNYISYTGIEFRGML